MWCLKTQRSSLVLAVFLSISCQKNTSPLDEQEDSASGGASSTLGDDSGESSAGGTSELSIIGGGPRYHPPKGFENCEHVLVKEECADGWCLVPAGCFVAGTPPDESYYRGAHTEEQMAVTLTHNIEVQQTEMTRKQWRDITGVDTSPDPSLACLNDDCPVTQVTWWDAVHAANLLSEQKGLTACYQPKECTGKLGQGLNCTECPGSSCEGLVCDGLSCAGFENPEDIIYECDGYRLLTRAEAEYTAKAGTISSFYSGDITIQPESPDCTLDVNLEKIAWYCHNSGGKTHPVAQLQSNGFGIFDILGNAREWLNDVQRNASSRGGEDPEGEITKIEYSVEVASTRIQYGGRSDLKAYSSRAATRSSSSWDTHNKWSAFNGFRLARSLPTK